MHFPKEDNLTNALVACLTVEASLLFSRYFDLGPPLVAVYPSYRRFFAIFIVIHNKQTLLKHHFSFLYNDLQQITCYIESTASSYVCTFIFSLSTP